jgi:hypothetical protein
MGGGDSFFSEEKGSTALHHEGRESLRPEMGGTACRRPVRRMRTLPKGHGRPEAGRIMITIGIGEMRIGEDLRPEVPHRVRDAST